MENYFITNDDLIYREKYLKYKKKYLELKKDIYGGGKSLILEKRGNMGYYLLTFKKVDEKNIENINEIKKTKPIFSFEYHNILDKFFNYIEKDGNPTNDYILDLTNISFTKTDKKGNEKQVKIDDIYKKKYLCKFIQDIADNEYNFTFPGPLKIYELTEIKEEIKKEPKK